MKLRLFVLAAALLLALAAADAAEQSTVPLSEYTVQRTRGKITIDGKLDEESWKSATPSQEWLFLDGKTRPTNATTVKVLWDKDTLYIAISCTDTDVRAKKTDRDDDVFNEDCVEFFIMEQLRKDKYGSFLEYEINALNTRFDAFNIGPLEAVLGWDSKGWRSAVKVDGTINNNEDTDKGWTVEMSIPFFDFYGTAFRTVDKAEAYYGRHRGQQMRFAPEIGDRWRADFFRIDKVGRRTQYIGWSPTLDGGFHIPDRFGTLIFSGDLVGEGRAAPVTPEMKTAPSDSH